MGSADELAAGLRSLNSLWVTRTEQAAQRLIGRPVRSFGSLSFETDLLPFSPESSDEVRAFVIVGSVR
jgi:hypothetical protein